VGYLTPNIAPDSATCRALFVPDSEECLAIVRGAIEELTFAYNWDKFGALSQEEAANLFVDMFDRLCNSEGPCRMIGEIIAYAGEISPKLNWLVCDGSEVLRSAYPDLYIIIGDTYGSAEPDYFRLPDMRGRSLSGAGSASGMDPVTVGLQYGEQKHTLTVAEMPTHNHVDSGHSHTTGNSLSSLAVMPGEGPVLVPNPIPALTGSAGANIGNSGDGSAHNTVGPRIGITYLIVAKDG
jgi:microcystin-dependent protein